MQAELTYKQFLCNLHDAYQHVMNDGSLKRENNAFLCIILENDRIKNKPKEEKIVAREFKRMIGTAPHKFYDHCERLQNRIDELSEKSDDSFGEYLAKTYPGDSDENGRRVSFLFSEYMKAKETD